MKTLTVDDYQRVRLPNAEPRTKFAYEENGNVITLTAVQAEPREAFPPGSLEKYFTPEFNQGEMATLKGCVQGPP